MFQPFRKSIISRKHYPGSPFFGESEGETGGFSPSDVSGLVLWLKADAITGLNDGDGVSTWPDSSGQNNNVSQGTFDKRPIYKTNIINGKPAVRFDGYDDCLDGPHLGITTSLTIFSVLTADTSGSPYFLNERDVAQMEAGYQMYFRSAASYKPAFQIARNGANWSDNWITSSIVPTHGQFYLISVWSEPASTTIDVNDTQDQDPGAGNDIYYGGSNAGITVGSWRNANPATDQYGGDIAEILIYNRKLTAAEIANVKNYLRDKYNL